MQQRISRRSDLGAFSLQGLGEVFQRHAEALLIGANQEFKIHPVNPRRREKTLKTQALQSLGHIHAILIADAVALIKVFQLHSRHRGAQRRHAELEAEARRRITLVRRWQIQQTLVMPEANHLLPQFGAVGEEHAAFRGRHQFVRLHAEDRGIGERAHRFAVIRRAVGVRGVFQNLEIVLLRNRDQCIHLRRHAEKVHDHDRLGARGDFLFNIIWIEADALRFGLREHRHAAAVQDGHDAGPPGRRGHNDFIAWADLKGVQRGVNGAGAVAVRHRMLHAQPFLVIFLERRGLIADGNLAGAQHAQHGVFIILGDDRPAIGFGLIERDGRCAPENGGSAGRAGRGRGGHQIRLRLAGQLRTHTKTSAS